MQKITNYEISRLQELSSNNFSKKGFNSKTYKKLLERRKAGEPLQYIEEEVFFFNIHVEVNPDVLIPRPETEFLVEEIINKIINPNKPVKALVKLISKLLNFLE